MSEEGPTGPKQTLEPQTATPTGKASVQPEAKSGRLAAATQKLGAAVVRFGMRESEHIIAGGEGVADISRRQGKKVADKGRKAAGLAGRELYYIAGGVDEVSNASKKARSHVSESIIDKRLKLAERARSSANKIADDIEVRMSVPPTVRRRDSSKKIPSIPGLNVVGRIRSNQQARRANYAATRASRERIEKATQKFGRQRQIEHTYGTGTLLDGHPNPGRHDRRRREWAQGKGYADEFKDPISGLQFQPAHPKGHTRRMPREHDILDPEAHEERLQNSGASPAQIKTQRAARREHQRLGDEIAAQETKFDEMEDAIDNKSIRMMQRARLMHRLADRLEGSHEAQAEETPTTAPEESETLVDSTSGRSSRRPPIRSTEEPSTDILTPKPGLTPVPEKITRLTREEFTKGVEEMKKGPTFAKNITRRFDQYSNIRYHTLLRSAEKAASKGEREPVTDEEKADFLQQADKYAEQKVLKEIRGKETPLSLEEFAKRRAAELEGGKVLEGVPPDKREEVMEALIRRDYQVYIAELKRSE